MHDVTIFSIDGQLAKEEAKYVESEKKLHQRQNKMAEMQQEINVLESALSLEKRLSTSLSGKDMVPWHHRSVWLFLLLWYSSFAPVCFSSFSPSQEHKSPTKS